MTPGIEEECVHLKGLHECLYCSSFKTIPGTMENQNQEETKYMVHDPPEAYKTGNNQQSKNGRDLSDILGSVSAESKPLEKTETMKMILYHTAFWSDPYILGMGQTFFKHCPVHQCYGTNDSSLLPSIEEFDAVIFHPWNMEKKWGSGKMKPWPQQRSTRQKYIMLNGESPRLIEFNGIYKILNGKIKYSVGTVGTSLSSFTGCDKLRVVSRLCRIQVHNVSCR